MKKIENKNLEMFISTIVELLEFTIMGCIAYFVLKVPLPNILIIMLVFFISRFAIGMQGHYKIVNYFDIGWVKCFSWTSALILSLTLTSKLGLLVGILFTIFTVFIISGKANIEDMALGWKEKGKPSKYADIEEYIKFNELNTRLVKFEDKLREMNNLDFMVYKYRFKDKLTFKQISDKLDIPTQRICDILDKIALTIRMLKEIY